MENPDRDARFARDQFIRALNSPVFDTSSDAHQQEFMRHMANRMRITDDAMNALIRQTWDRRGPTPVLRPVITPPQPQVLVAEAPVQQNVLTVDHRDFTPFQLLKIATDGLTGASESLVRINQAFKDLAIRNRWINYPRIHFSNYTKQFAINYVQTVGLVTDNPPLPIEMGAAIIQVDRNHQSRLATINMYLQFIDRLLQSPVIRNSEGVRLDLQRIRQQIATYDQEMRKTNPNQVNLYEYMMNMKGWLDQLATLNRNNPPPVVPNQQPEVQRIQQTQPIPGGLLVNNITNQDPLQAFTLPFQMVNKPAPSYSNQPLSPTAKRKNSTLLFNPTTATFVKQTQQVYLETNSKEYKDLDQLRKVAEQLLEQESRQPRNVRPLYRTDLQELSNSIRVYLSSNLFRGIDLYDYIRQVQGFTDQLKSIQEKIAARPVPRYHPDLDPEILHEPESLRRPITKIGPNELLNLVKMLRVLTEIAQDEVSKFGREGVFFQDIDTMLNDLQDQIQFFTHQGRSVAMPTQEFLAILVNWRDAIQDLIDQRKALGRRCVNDTDPWDNTPIIEIPDNEYIRLSNGMCWHIQSLMEYITGINGENTSKGLAGYASNKLWEDESDVKRILDHPLVKADPEFKKYFMNVVYGKQADKISVKTLEMMYRTASLFVSRGQPFNQEIQRVLTPKQYSIFMKYAGGDAYSTRKIPANKQREEIETAITLILKSDATHDFWEYYDKLSQEEKEAIRSFRKDFESALRECRFGKPNDPANKLCVYVMANVILPVVYRVAEIKGLQVEKLNTSEQ